MTDNAPLSTIKISKKTIISILIIMFTVTATNYHNPNEEQNIMLSIHIPGSIEQHTEAITQIITNIFEQNANKLQSVAQSRIVSTIKVKRKI